MNLDMYLSEESFTRRVDSYDYIDYATKVLMKRVYGNIKRRGHQLEMGGDCEQRD
jgi:hypothetical protein